MGLKGNLLPSLKKNFASQIHVGDLEGATIGLDAMVWVHRFLIRYAHEFLVEGDFTLVVGEFLRRLQWWQKRGVVIVPVFDGMPLPGKSSTNDERSERRQANMAEAMELFEVGEMGSGMDDETATQYHKLLSKAVYCDRELIDAIIRALRKGGYAYFVSPFESDAQLEFLFREQVIDWVMTIDGDLVA